MCHSGFDILFIQLGAPIPCTFCGQKIVPKMVAGTAYPNTGYQITFADFEQLLTDHRYRPSVAELLSQWYGYEVAPDGESISVRSKEGAPIDLVWLHRRIQRDSAKQHTLYKAAMALWR
jgi:hypothetical protein